MPFVIMLIEYLSNIDRQSFYLSPFALFVDPVFTFIIFFVDRMSSSDVLSIFGGSHGGIWNIIRNPNLYMLISIVVQMAVTAFFVHLSARRIGPSTK